MGFVPTSAGPPSMARRAAAESPRCGRSKTRFTAASLPRRPSPWTVRCAKQTQLRFSPRSRRRAMDPIRFEVTDRVGWLLMNRPERMNGMTNQMLVETHDCLQQVAARTDVRVVVLTGEGRGFCPGADLKHY